METTLIVKDHDEVRQLTAAILEECGYQVLQAGAGAEAMVAAADHPGPIHLLLTDVLMPHMSGQELAERLRQARPEIKVLYMSGYAAEVFSRSGAGSGIEYIQKPFTPEDLALKIREVLCEG